VEEVVTCGRLKILEGTCIRPTGHVERKDKSDWVSAWRGQRVRGEVQRRRNIFVKVHIERLCLVKGDAHKRVIIEISGEVCQLQTIQHYLSTVMRAA